MHNRIPKPSQNGHAVGCNGQPTKTPSKPVSDGAENAKAIPNSGRMPDGRFAGGNKLGRGNPFARRLGAMRTAFLDAVSADDVAAVARKLAALAAAGDIAAAALYLSYALGKPVPAVNPDTLDLNEFALADAAPTRSRVTAVLLDGVDPATATAIVRSVAANRNAENVIVESDLKQSKIVRDEQAARIGKPAAF